MPDLNEKAINAIKNFQNKIDSMGLPFVLLRKLNGIRNAIEMHVEDYMVFPEVFECLCKAYIEQAKIFKEPYRNEIISAFRKCEKEIRKSLIKKAEQVSAGDSQG
ncbi:MAG: hypothetical protein LWX02_09630 [Deltaproteobacteria bacterium]|jgi:hypothetical protein|nr:hypothetical protein [Deltaproteobacteria bacterium]MDL1988193.1 hypothetical protein [Deltaproteobacteria bacterium]